MDELKDFGKGEKGVLKRWLTEIDLADKAEKDWRSDAEDVLKTYRGEDMKTSPGDGGQSRYTNSFNILWSNTETMRPALYNSTPQPVVKRRFRDEDPIGHAASEVLERSVKYAIDAYDFDERISLAVNDFLLPGRGVTRVRYVPTFAEMEEEANEEGESVEEEMSEEGIEYDSDGEREAGDEEEGEESEYLAYEEVLCEHVNWEDFRHGPGRIWSEVTWVAFRHKLSREELRERFKDEVDEEKLDQIPLDLKPRGQYDNEPTDEYEEACEILGRATVWEIWDKDSKKVYFICPGYKSGPLKTEDDPLNLQDFFPVPRPIYSIDSANSLIPVPEYHQYETLARELTKCTRRIMNILDALRVRGGYDSTLGEIGQILDKGDNELVPISNLAKVYDNGGLQNAIWMMPVQELSQVVQNLYQYRQALIQNIYEITGISDIMRGSSRASETATAQQIKSNFGTLRLQRKQRELQRFIRDLVRMKAELIGENFSIETLQQMTGLQFPTMQEKMAIQQRMQFMMQQYQYAQMQAQQMGGEPPPEPDMSEFEEILEKPTWEEIKEVLSNDMLRQFRVDIETDSTIAEQMAGEKQEVMELLGGITDYLGGMAPFVQQGAVPMETAKTLLMSAVRRFKLGTEVESALDKIGEGSGQQGPTEAEIKAQEAQMKMQMEQQKMQMEMQLEQARQQHEMEKLRREAEIDRLEHEQRMREIQAETQSELAVQNAQAQGDIIRSQT